jgi:hypothetical protein
MVKCEAGHFWGNDWVLVKTTTNCNYQTELVQAALVFLQEEKRKGSILCGGMGLRSYYFSPQSFYEYMWMCFNQGLGYQFIKPPLAPTTLSDNERGYWYSESATKLSQEVIQKWHNGLSLEEQLECIPRSGYGLDLNRTAQLAK